MQTKHKLLAAGLFSVAFLVVSAHAGSINDQSRWTNRERILNAFANPDSPDSKVNMPTVDMKGVPIKGFGVPLRGIDTRPSPSRREINTIEHPNVELTRRDLSTPDVGTRISPLTNFTGKRAIANDRLPPDVKLRPREPRASINDRVIYTGTPDGQSELKEQLNRRP